MAKGLTAMGAEAPLTGQMTSVSADVTRAWRDLGQELRKEWYGQCEQAQPTEQEGHSNCPNCPIEFYFLKLCMVAFSGFTLRLRGFGENVRPLVPRRRVFCCCLF